MNKRLEVKITNEDIADSVRKTERYCVVSTAIGRLNPEVTRIEVNVNTIRFSVKESEKTYRLAYRTPAPVQEYIRAFDAGSQLKPMTFVLDNPQIVEKAPSPRLRAKTPSFKPQGPAQSRRSIRVLGEKAFSA